MTQALVPVMPNPGLLLNRQELQRIVERLLREEESVLANAEQMVQVQERSSIGSTSWSRFRSVVSLTKRRILALKEGLIPVRVGGTAYSLATLVAEDQSIPANIVTQAEEARRRLPSVDIQVYGWDRNALPQERRQRDPILIARMGGANFLLGFWLEIQTPNEHAPEFIGFTMPWAVKRGRGRPRKQASLYA